MLNHNRGHVEKQEVEMEMESVNRGLTIVLSSYFICVSVKEITGG